MFFLLGNVPRNRRMGRLRPKKRRQKCVGSDARPLCLPGWRSAVPNCQARELTVSEGKRLAEVIDVLVFHVGTRDHD